jgi:hypothetical protein
MGHDFSLTKEEIESLENKKSLLKGQIAYKVDDALEFPDLENNFKPNKVKRKEKVKTTIVDLKKKPKNKSNQLYE